MPETYTGAGTAALPPSRLSRRGGGADPTPDSPCRNCGDPTVGQFCRSCGQRKAEVRISLRRMLLHVLDDQFSINSALPRTLSALFLRPGLLTHEYVNGRIVRYIQPLRLYLVSSVAFFLLLSLFGDFGGKIRLDPEMRAGLEAARDSALVRGDTLEAARIGRTMSAVDAAGEGEAVPVGAVLEGVDISIPGVAKDGFLQRRLQRIAAMTPTEAMQAIRAEFLSDAPTMMFVLLPVFALLLKLLYVRRQRFYVEHFVFSLHFHAFAFLLFSVMLLVRSATLNLALAAWLSVYLLWAMKRVYGQSLLKTVVKGMVLAGSYGFVLVFALVCTLLVALLLL